MIDLGRLLDSIEDAERDYYLFTVDILSSKGVNFNTYEKRDGIKTGRGLAKDLIQTTFLHKYMNLRKVILEEYILLLFPDDTISCTQINTFTFNVKLITKGPSRLTAERRSVFETKEYVNKIIDDFISSVKFNAIVSLTKNDMLVNSFYRRFCTPEELAILKTISEDKNFRIIDDELEKQYEEIHEAAVRKLIKIKDQLTNESKYYTTFDYYRDFDVERYRKIKQVIEEDRINKFSNHIENELVLL